MRNTALEDATEARCRCGNLIRHSFDHPGVSGAAACAFEFAPGTYCTRCAETTTGLPRGVSGGK